MNGLQLVANLRDYWSDWRSAVNPDIARIMDPSCYTKKWYSAPDDTTWTLAAGAYLRFQISIVPGSFITSISHLLGPGNGFSFQITDESLGYPWFNAPCPDTVFSSAQLPIPLPTLYPVTGSGLFTCEFWNTDSANSQRCQIILDVAEPK